MNTKVTMAISALLLSTAPAFALDFGNGFSLTGDVELEYVDYQGGSNTFAFADLTLGWRSQSDSALGFGFDLTTVNFYDFDYGDDLSQLWGGLVLTTGYGEFTIGSPRPLMDTLSQAPDVGLTRIYGLELGFFAGSYIATIAQFEPEVEVFGATFEGGSGSLSYGIGLHRANGFGDHLNVLELTAGYQAGATQVYGGLERLSGSGPGLTKLTLGARYGADRLALGAEATNLDPPSGSSKTVFTLYGEYQVADGLTVGAQYVNVDDFYGESIYGLSGEYSMGSGGFAQLGWAKTTNSNNNVMQASIGFDF